jgi:hypothetical protein
MTLPSGQQASVAVDGAALAALQAAQPNVAQVSLVYDPAPAGINPPQQGIGAAVLPVGSPVDIKLVLRDAAGNPVTPTGAAATAEAVLITLPVLAQPAQPDLVFAWLQAVYGDDGGFLGYARPAATFDPATGTLTWRTSVAALQGTLFLPALLGPAWVQNHDPLVHVFSGPTRQALDFGFAGPQFTTFTVMAPQLGLRLYVYSPVVDNYAWIDVPGVGPSGPPRD